MACHGPRNSKVAKLRSCNQGFHNVGIGSLFAIFVSHASLSIFLSFSRQFSENSLQRGAYRWLQKKERRKKAGRILFALHENILNGKKIISIAVDAFFQLNEYTLLPIFWDLTMERCIGVSHDILEIIIGLDGWI